MSTIASVATPILNKVASYLIPQYIFDGILSTVTPDAFTFGLGGEANIPLSDDLIDGVGGFELLRSPITGNSALYGYLGGALSTSGNFSASGSFSLGFVDGTPSSKNYTEWFGTISLPFTELPANIRDKIQNTLLGMFARPNLLNDPVPGWDDLKYVKYTLYVLKQAQLDARWIMSKLNNLTANFFFDPTGGGAWGMSLSYQLAKTQSTTPSQFSTSLTYYWQLAPKQYVPFE